MLTVSRCVGAATHPNYHYSEESSAVWMHECEWHIAASHRRTPNERKGGGCWIFTHRTSSTRCMRHATLSLSRVDCSRLYARRMQASSLCMKPLCTNKRYKRYTLDTLNSYRTRAIWLGTRLAMFVVVVGNCQILCVQIDFNIPVSLEWKLLRNHTQSWFTSY